MAESKSANAHKVLVAGEKGGTGKTTLLTNLAAYRHSVTGNECLIVDTDRQGSATDWVYYRNEAEGGGIDVVQLHRKNILTEIPKKARRYADIFVDAGGRDSKDLRYAIRQAHTMLIPVRASQYDLATIGDLSAQIREIRQNENPRLRAYVVVNLWKNHPALGEFDEALKALNGVDGIQPIDFPICDRIAFTRSAGEGKGVTEIDPKSKAATEIKKLYEAIYE